MATLIVENGAGIANANAYGAVGQVAVDVLAFARLFASNRGVSLSLDDNVVSTQLINAVDYLESMNYVGSPVLYTQALSWPRQNVLFDPSTPFPTNQVPVQVLNAQYQLVIEQANGIVLNPSVDRSAGGFIIEQRVDVLTTRYSERVGTSSYPSMPKVTAFLRTVVIANVAMRTVRV